MRFARPARRWAHFRSPAANYIPVASRVPCVWRRPTGRGLTRSTTVAARPMRRGPDSTMHFSTRNFAGTPARGRCGLRNCLAKKRGRALRRGLRRVRRSHTEFQLDGSGPARVRIRPARLMQLLLNGHRADNDRRTGAGVIYRGDAEGVSLARFETADSVEG
jgi:hypothetical protein